MALPNVTVGLLNKYRHIAARARGEAASGATHIVGVLAVLLSTEPLEPTEAEPALAARAFGAVYGAPQAGAGRLSLTA